MFVLNRCMFYLFQFYVVIVKYSGDEVEGIRGNSGEQSS